MGKITGFLEIERRDITYAPAADRIRHFKEFIIPLDDEEVVHQAARCMDCGIPYCHTGCPVNNQIPDWNDLVYTGDWEEAARNLHSTNNFPEFTGRICPAPCEEACTLALEDVPVTIKTVECAVADKAFEQGWVAPQPPTEQTGKKVAVIGGGTAGMACAQQLARRGHEVHVFEREAKAGGLLRYGIPDFKMEKYHIDRRVQQMEAEGVIFHYNKDVGVNCSADEIVDAHDAVLLGIGSERPRDVPIPGRELNGVRYAMPYLVQQNKRLGGEDISDEIPILADGKNVIVIGGGDTASDCVGTAFRQSAVSVTQIDIRPIPPMKEDKMLIWPDWPVRFRTSSSQAEGAEREFSTGTIEIVGEAGRVNGVKCARVDQDRVPIPESEFIIRAELVLVAIGFAGPVHKGLLDDLGLAIDGDKEGRSTLTANDIDYVTSNPKVFAAGDLRRGQSLTVWAIREGRQAAHAIDKFLMGSSDLPR